MEALSAFHFLRPWWLLAIPLWIWLVAYVWRKGANGDGWAAVCDPALLSYLIGESGTQQQRSKVALSALIIAGCASLIALAGPAWKQLPQPVYRAQSALVIGLDLSRSMLAEDIKPNRLQRAKQKLQDILTMRKEGQTALVVFAGSAFDVVPMTSDNRAILAMLDALDPSMMPAQGSRASTALKHAEAIFRRNAIKHGTVLLLTDGVDIQATEMAEELVKKGHRVSIIGVGTKAAAPIPDNGESGGFVKDDNGNIVIPRLQSDVLKHLADSGHGVYQPIRFDDADINHIPGLKPSATDAISKQEKLQTDLWREEGPWLLLLVLPLLSLAFRRGVLLSLLLLPFILPDGAHAMGWKDLWLTPDQQGQALMQQKKPEAAAELFQNSDWKAVSLYRAKKYQQAADVLKAPDSADDWYNRGNALAKAGDLKAALDAYDHALKLDKTHQDARFNRDLVKKAMQQSRKQQSDQKKSNRQKQADKQNKGEQQNNQQDKNRQGQKEDERGNQGQSASGQDRSQQTGQKQSGQKGGEHKKKASGQKQADQKKKHEQKNEQNKGKQQSQATPQDHGAQQQQSVHAPDKAEERRNKEASAELQQWLRRIPDDPGGLLRRKFRYQYQQESPLNKAGAEQW